MWRGHSLLGIRALRALIHELLASDNGHLLTFPRNVTKLKLRFSGQL